MAAGGAARLGGAAPWLLAAGAAALLAAASMLWALRGLPLGTPALWLTPLPILAAGLGFGAASGAVAALGAAALVTAFGSPTQAAIFAVLFGAPAALLVAAAQRGGGLTFGPPLALLGLWPAGVLLAAALLVPDEGGVEAAMRRGVELGLSRLGLDAPEQFVSALVRVKAAALGGWTMLMLLANGVAAHRLLHRAGLARATPDWTATRLPAWYPLLPSLLLPIVLLAPDGTGAVPLSALLLLLLPLALLGVAGVHRRLRPRPGRRAILGAFYVCLFLFLQLLGPALVGLGLHDQLRRPATPPTT